MRWLTVFIVAWSVSLSLGHQARAQAKVTRSVTNESIEAVLQGLNIKFQKGERKEKDVATTYFNFDQAGLPVRLFNYGSDLWLETTLEKKMDLDQVNRWNAQAKFSRLVLIDGKDKATLSLEAQLDCLGGITEASIRQFVVRFEEETKKFAKFVK